EIGAFSLVVAQRGADVALAKGELHVPGPLQPHSVIAVGAGGIPRIVVPLVVMEAVQVPALAAMLARRIPGERGGAAREPVDGPAELPVPVAGSRRLPVQRTGRPPLGVAVRQVHVQS